MERILFIVDDPKMWEFMSFYLAMQGYKVYRSSRPGEAFELAQSTRPGLVVIDNTPGKFDTRSFYERFINDPSLNQSRLLVLTSPADHTALKDIQRNTDQFITIPIRPKMLLIIIRGLLQDDKLGWIRLSKDFSTAGSAGH